MKIHLPQIIYFHFDITGVSSNLIVKILEDYDKLGLPAKITEIARIGEEFSTIEFSCYCEKFNGMLIQTIKQYIERKVAEVNKQLSLFKFN